MILDLLAYDAFPALAALEAGTSGKNKLNKHLCLFNGFFGWFPSLLWMWVSDNKWGIVWGIKSSWSNLNRCHNWPCNGPWMNANKFKMFYNTKVKLFDLGIQYELSWLWDQKCHGPNQEVASSKRMMCGSVVLNAAPGTLQTRVANALYESCRNGSAVLPNFPEYEPVVKALQENNTIDNSVGYKVCVAKCGRLLVLQSLARRWTEYEGNQRSCTWADCRAQQRLQCGWGLHGRWWKAMNAENNHIIIDTNQG